MEQKNSYRKKRTIWVWVGLGIAFLSRMLAGASWDVASWDTAIALSYSSYFVWVLGAGALIYGSYCWAKYKGRHGAFALLGLLAPIGFIPLALMKDKYPVGDKESE